MFLFIPLKTKKSRKLKIFVSIFLYLFVLQFVVAQKSDAEGSMDHPLLTRFNQSYIYDYEETSFDVYTIVTGGMEDSKFSSTQEVEGRIYRIFYSLPTDAGSSYEIYSNYMNALKSHGATILFSCKNVGECGKYFWDELRGVDKKLLLPAYYGEEMAYIAAKFSKDGKGYYLTVIPGYGLGEQGYHITVVEVQEMDQQINLEGIEKAMLDQGKVSLYGILFDTGSDKLKESSFTEVDLIAQYLKKNKDKKVYVVGHTDNTGSYQNNMELSERRAAALNKVLVSKYGISENRLTAAGVGPLSPESKNTTDEGRQKNRRVEIVLNEI